MGTPYIDIYELFLTGVKDYQIDRLYQVGSTPFNDYLESFLIKAIPDFHNCVQNLGDRNSTEKTFNITLTELEKSILSDLMQYHWFTKEVNDVTQFNLLLSDTDFKHFSESHNLREKSERLDRLREIYEQKMGIYGFKNIPWSDWLGGSYG